MNSLFSAYASLSALALLLRSIFRDFIPDPVRTYFLDLLNRLFTRRPDQLTLVIDEVCHQGLERDENYAAAETYLPTIITSPSTGRLKISKSPKDKSHTFRLVNEEQIHDSYENIAFHWRFRCLESDKLHHTAVGSRRSEIRFFELSFDKQYQDKAIHSYLPHILAKSKSIKDEDRPLKLCTLAGRFNGGSINWQSTNFDHPSTFDTLAMDPEMKSAIMGDLDRFTRKRKYYRKVGRAWKRGYLLYGPPGTGKSSLIAAMANYLRFDIYDLQLGSCTTDADLRRLLFSTSSRSILVVEDVDCTLEVDIKNRRNDGGSIENGQVYKPQEVQLTLSGLLNFIDGLWSNCVDERIIVFTTNHKEKLDPALIRPGRMDKRIPMSYLTFPAFKILASNYLEIEGDHRLFGDIERLIQTVKVTPAQVAEELMQFEDADKALEGVLELLEIKRKEIMGNKEVVKGEKAMNGTLEN